MRGANLTEGESENKIQRIKTLVNSLSNIYDKMNPNVYIYEFKLKLCLRASSHCDIALQLLANYLAREFLNACDVRVTLKLVNIDLI